MPGIQILYPFDPTGKALTNLITEEQILTPPNGNDYYFVVPKLAPFFRDSLKVRHFPSGKLLVEGQDYVCAHQFIGASRATMHPVYGSISFYNRTLAGILHLDYQTIGGEWTASSDKITEILSNATIDPRITTWEHVVNYPSHFPPIEHEWDVTNLVGMSAVVSKLNELSNAIRQGADDTAALHYANKNNPHETTKAHVGLALVANLGISSTFDALQGISNAAYMTPLLVKQSIDQNALALVNAHANLSNNPHNTTQAQVGLSLVSNYGIATQTQAELGAAADKYMTPLLVRYAITAQVGSALATHLNDRDNPHGMTALQLNLEKVQNYGIADQTQAEAGVRNDLYMTALRVKQAIASQSSTALQGHIDRVDNPHGTNKTHIGLSLVPNYAMADDIEAVAGLRADLFMSPKNVKAVIAQLTAGGIADHVNNTENPHGTTAAQINVHTKEEITELLTHFLAVNSTAANSQKFDGKTPAEFREWFNTQGEVTATTFGGKTPSEFILNVLSGTSANSETLTGKTVAEIVQLAVESVGDASKFVKDVLVKSTASNDNNWTLLATVDIPAEDTLDVIFPATQFILSGAGSANAVNVPIFAVSMMYYSDINRLLNKDKFVFIENLTPFINYSAGISSNISFSYRFNDVAKKLELWLKCTGPCNRTKIAVLNGIGADFPQDLPLLTEPVDLIQVPVARAALSDIKEVLSDITLLKSNTTINNTEVWGLDSPTGVGYADAELDGLGVLGSIDNNAFLNGKIIGLKWKDVLGVKTYKLTVKGPFIESDFTNLNLIVESANMNISSVSGPTALDGESHRSVFECTFIDLINNALPVNGTANISVSITQWL